MILREAMVNENKLRDSNDKTMQTIIGSWISFMESILIVVTADAFVLFPDLHIVHMYTYRLVMAINCNYTMAFMIPSSSWFYCLTYYR